MIPDSAILDASGRILDVGAIGGVLFFVTLALMWVTRQWLKALNEKHAMMEERLVDRREIAEIGEATRVTLRELAEALRANTAAVNTMIEVSRDRSRQ